MSTRTRATLVGGLLAFPLLLAVGCQKQDFGLPNRDTVGKGTRLPIDGTWEIQPDGGLGVAFKAKLDAGRMIFLDGPGIKTGSVLITGLMPLDGGRYTGTRLAGKGNGKGYYETKTTLEVVSSTEMLEHIDQFQGDALLNYNWRWTKITLLDENAFTAAHGNKSNAADPVFSNLWLSDTLERVYSGEEIVTSVLGVDQRITRSRTLDQSVDFSKSLAIERGAELNLELVKAHLTARIEQRTGVQLKKLETITREAIVSGSTGGRKYKLTWYDLVRTGTVSVQKLVGAQTLAFRYKESAFLEISPLN